MNDFSKLTKKIKSFLSGRSKTDFLIVFFLGILLMIVAVPTSQNTEKKKADSPAEQPEEAMGQGKTGMDALDYKRELEKQLENLLSKMEGTGSCKVMITLSDQGRVYVDKNVKSEDGKQEQESVVYRLAEGEGPYVIRQDYPKIEGVVVVTQGGGNAKTVAQISNAVMSLFQIEPHKITVVKMSLQEE